MKPERIKYLIGLWDDNIKRHKYFPGNYENTCTYCKKEIRWCDKMCFICEDCMDERLKDDFKENTP